MSDIYSPIPYAMNPFGIDRGVVTWRNFYDNPITWTDFNAISLSSYTSAVIDIEFTIPETFRGNVNLPIFGGYGGSTCPLFLSRSSQNVYNAYTFSSTGRYVFRPNQRITTGSHRIIYTMTPGSVNTLTLDGVEILNASAAFPGFPTTGANVSQADVTIQSLKVYGDNALIWQDANSDLTI